jgi:hypothetical protein
MQKKDLLERTGFAATALAGTSLSGSITLATVPVAVTSTVSAGGLAGLLGFTTTATTIVASPIAVPVAGIIATGALISYGAYEAIKFCRSLECNELLEKIQLALENKFLNQASNLWAEISQIVDIKKLKAIYKAIKTALTPDDVRVAFG